MSDHLMFCPLTTSTMSFYFHEIFPFPLIQNNQVRSHFLSLLQRNENSVRATFPLCSLQSFLAAKAALCERNLFHTGIVALVLRFHPEHL